MNIVIPRQTELEELKKIFKKEGSSGIHVLADFDGTLTKYKVGGKEIPSVISLLRTENYMSPEYSSKATELQKKYYPIEIDPNISLQEKKSAMYEWWTKHFELLIESGLNKSHLEKIVESGRIEFRQGALAFIDLLHERDIPLIIISSSGVGNVLPMLLEKENRMYDNISIITNLYEWDNMGRALKVKEPIITVMNKDERVLSEIPKIYEKVKERKKVLILGDSLGDLGMINGFDYNALIKIGFLNKKVKERINKYEQEFDVVIKNDGDFNYVNNIMREVLT